MRIPNMKTTVPGGGVATNLPRMISPVSSRVLSDDVLVAVVMVLLCPDQIDIFERWYGPSLVSRTEGMVFGKSTA